VNRAPPLAASLLLLCGCNVVLGLDGDTIIDAGVGASGGGAASGSSSQGSGGGSGGGDCALEWKLAAPMSKARIQPVAVVLDNGEVLVLGGFPYLPGGPLATAEIYDSARDDWRAAGESAGGGALVAVRMLDGRVLVAGGSRRDTGEPVADAQIYDPATEEWAAAAPMATARMGAVAALLVDGRVLVAGGWDSTAKLASAELYDPETDTWAPAASLSTARGGAVGAFRLESGAVLVPGGADSESTELYEPGLDLWMSAGEMAVAHVNGGGVYIEEDDAVLVAGGLTAGDEPIGTADLWSSGGKTWSLAGALSHYRDGPGAARLPNHQILVAGGVDASTVLTTTDQYDPATGSWQPGPDLRQGHAHFALVALGDGRLLLLGGGGVVNFGLVGTASAEILECE